MELKVCSVMEREGIPFVVFSDNFLIHDLGWKVGDFIQVGSTGDMLVLKKIPSQIDYEAEFHHLVLQLEP